MSKALRWDKPSPQDTSFSSGDVTAAQLLVCQDWCRQALELGRALSVLTPKSHVGITTPVCFPQPPPQVTHTMPVASLAPTTPGPNCPLSNPAWGWSEAGAPLPGAFTGDGGGTWQQKAYVAPTQSHVSELNVGLHFTNKTSC